jgi:trimethylamine:corrinoid methyltransferase-like protein
MESLVGVKPDVISYSTVMTAWTRSGHPDKAQRAQLLYDEMIQKYKAGDKGVKPGPPAFEVLISAWCESGQPDAIQKAQVVLDDMLARFRSGEVELEPSVEKLRAMMDAVKTNDRKSH